MCGSKKRERGRPRGFKEDEALAAVTDLFWRNGYAGTSLEQIVAASRVPRATLYQLYGDKRAIFIRALRLYVETYVARVDAALSEEPDGRGALKRLLAASADRLADPDAPDGCLRCLATLEMAGRDAQIDAALAEANGAFLRQMARVVDRAVGDGELDPDRTAGLALFLTTIVNGMATLSRAGATRAELDRIVDHALLHFDAAGP